MKLLETNDKKKILKANVKKNTFNTRTQELSETVQARRQWNDIFKMLIGKKPKKTQYKKKPKNSVENYSFNLNNVFLLKENFPFIESQKLLLE